MKQENICEAAITLRNAIKSDSDLFNAFVSSAESAINEAKNYISNHNLAIEIIERIVGLD